MVETPTQRLNKVLSGEVDLADEDSSIQSWCQFFIYQGACAVLSRPTKKERQEALSRLPDRIRPYVEKEAIRLWKLRS